MLEIDMHGELSEWWVSANYVKNRLIEANNKNILLRINSKGGSLIEAFAIANALREYKQKTGANIEAIIDGYCLSSAVYILTVLDKVMVYDNSILMIHNVMINLQDANKKELTQKIELLTDLEQVIIKAYSKMTGKSEEELTKKLNSEFWLVGQKIIDFGFAHELVKSNDSNKIPTQPEEELKKDSLTIYKNYNNKILDEVINKYNDLKKCGVNCDIIKNNVTNKGVVMTQHKYQPQKTEAVDIDEVKKNERERIREIYNIKNIGIPDEEFKTLQEEAVTNGYTIEHFAYLAYKKAEKAETDAKNKKIDIVSKIKNDGADIFKKSLEIGGSEENSNEEDISKLALDIVNKMNKGEL